MSPYNNEQKKTKDQAVCCVYSKPCIILYLLFKRDLQNCLKFLFCAAFCAGWIQVEHVGSKSSCLLSVNRKFRLVMQKRWETFYLLSWVTGIEVHFAEPLDLLNEMETRVRFLFWLASLGHRLQCSKLLAVLYSVGTSLVLWMS